MIFTRDLGIGCCYYQTYLSSNHKNMKKLWTGIRSIVNIKHKAIVQVSPIYENNSLIKDPRMIANTFNNFFVNVGKNIDEKIPFSGAFPEKFFRN